MSLSTSTSSAPPEPASHAQLDAAIEGLAVGVAQWAELGLRERADLLDATHAAVVPTAREWVRIASDIKRLAPDSSLVGEEWMSGPYAVLAALRSYATALRALAAGRSPVDRARIGHAPGGRTTVRAMPHDAQHAVLLHGHSVEVWMPPGVEPARVRAEAGLGATRVGENGGVGVVLGAGNITSIAPLDALYELIAFNRASVVKLNPTFARLLPVYLEALAPLIEFGVVRVVNGDGAVGGYLTTHPGIAHVHITGSSTTHDAIVWGTSDEAAKRRATNDPKLSAPITSELGGVSPIIVVPGAWTKRDLRYQAEHVATMRLHNAGHNCIAGQVVVLSSDWAQKDAFVAELEDVLRELPERKPWYPGAEARVERAEASHADAEDLGGRVLIPDADADVCTTEYFAPVLGIVALPGSGAEFLRHAVAFSNGELVGTLGANVIVQPKDRRAMGDAFDTAIADLRYGTISINSWTSLGFLTPEAPWGAFPGNTLDDVGSGIGVVHNAFLLSEPERVVTYGPFRPLPRSLAHGELSLFPKPPWFVTARSAARTGELLNDYGAAPGWGKITSIFLSALKA